MKKQGSNHPHLLMKQLKQQLKRSKINIKDIIIQMNIDYYELNKDSIKDILSQIRIQAINTPQYRRFQQYSHGRIKEQIDNLYTSDSRKHTYLVDCAKQVTTFPLIKDRDFPSYNLHSLYKENISKELRRVVWMRIFNIQQYRKAYLLVDREITPYNIIEELKISLQRLALMENLTLKQNQKDVALRIMEYFVKINNKIPHRYHNYIALIVVELFSFFSISKIVDLGACALGLIHLSEKYRQSDAEVRFKKIMKAICIIDPQSSDYINTHYIESGNGRRQLNECYQYFRLTFGSSHLSIDISQYLIDQLLIRKFCAFDMYSMFAIMILIISDQFNKEQKQKPSLKEILNKSKSIIKLQDFIDAYQAIYESIPVFHSSDDIQYLSKNQLFMEMISSAKSQQPQGQQNFIIELETEARIGNRV